jgi:hypothetical protein
MLASNYEKSRKMAAVDVMIESVGITVFTIAEKQIHFGSGNS